jgi:hypothetical protein
MGGQVDQVEVRVESPDPRDIRELTQWLRRQTEVRRHGRLTERGGPADPEAMSDLLDAITLVVGTGLSTAQLLLAIVGWRQARREPDPPVVIVISGNRKVIVDIDDVDELMRRLGPESGI